VIEDMLPVRLLVRLALRQRIRAFATVNQAHSPIIAPEPRSDSLLGDFATS
jgi:hypothetical protein